MNKQVSDALRLLVVTVAAGAVLGWVYNITEKPIEAQQALKVESANKAVMPLADSFERLKGDKYSSEVIEETFTAKLAESPDGSSYANDSINDVLAATKEGKLVGYVVTVTSHDGYNGDIQYSVGIDVNGTVEGISLLSIAETPGLGMKAKSDPAFLEQYRETKTDKFTVVKDGSGNTDKPAEQKTGSIDAISGSTITSKSITGGVNAALEVYRILSVEEGTPGDMHEDRGGRGI